MTSALRNRLADAKTAADQSVKDKADHGPLSDPVPDLHLVAPGSEPGQLAPESTGANVQAPPLAETPTSAVAPAAKPTRARSATALAPPSSSAVATDVVAQLAAPPAAMGMAVESRLLAVPMTEDAYRLLQHLDRDLAMARRRPVNRVRLLTLALERVLAGPDGFHDRYLAMYEAGASWKRRVQARIPVDLADELPVLRYTGESRQSAGMLVSIAVSELLTEARTQLDAAM